MANIEGLQDTFEKDVKLGVGGLATMPQVRLVDIDQDYETLSAWYQGYGQTPPHKSEFGKVGFMIDNLGAIGILSTDSSITFFEPLIGNPNAEPSERGAAIASLIEMATDYCKMQGQRNIYVLASNPKVASMDKKYNFIKAGDLTLFRRIL